MKHKFTFFIILLLTLVMSCESDGIRTKNPFVPTYPFAYTVNMNLPMYSSLLYPNNAVLITLGGVGTNGVIVFNAGGSYRAYEASCPNQSISNCSRLEIDGIHAVCPCDDLRYSLYTGVPIAEGQYTLIPYRVERSGNTLTISN